VHHPQRRQGAVALVAGELHHRMAVSHRTLGQFNRVLT
jgi:hypothetical protein